MAENNNKLAELNKQLEEVTQIGIACAQSVKSTQKAEREYMVAVYMWWRSAHKQAGYLDSLYKAHHFGNYYKQKKGINFTPLIRLTTGDALGKDFDSIWNRALNAIHEKFEKNESRFKVKTAEKLTDLFEANGGKTGLAEQWKLSKDDEKPATEFEQWLEFELDVEEFFQTLADGARTHYANKQNLPSLNLQPVQQDHNGYSTILVKHSPNGIVIIGSSADNSLVDQSLVATYRSDFDAVPIKLRSILETVHVLNTPNSASKDHNKFVEKTKFDDPFNSNTKLKQRRRIIYSNSENCFLNSPILSRSGPIVKAYPKASIFDQIPSDLHLIGDTHNWIETVLLRSRLFNAYTANNNGKFSLHQINDYRHYATELTSKFVLSDEDDRLVRNHVKNLRNETICWQPFFERKIKHSAQLNFNFLNYFDTAADFCDFDWRTELSIQALRKLAVEFVEPWVSEYAEKHKRPMNSTLKLELSDDIKIGYEKSETTQAHDIQYAFGSSNSKSMGKLDIFVRSIDFTFILRQISDLNLISPLYIFAQSTGLILLFETKANCFFSYIPSCNIEGVRSEANFGFYHPETVDRDQFYTPLDDNFAPNEPDYSDIDDAKAVNSDLIKIENTINRLRGKN
jgi:hypothetical protein